MPRPLTVKEKDIFEMIRTDPNAVLVQVTFDGEETAAIAFAQADEDGSGGGSLWPVAILLTDDMSDKISNPFAG